jgi:hypothetical protein
MNPEDLKVGSLFQETQSPRRHLILLSKSYVGRTFLLKWLQLETQKIFVSRRFRHQLLYLTLIEFLDVK